MPEEWISPEMACDQAFAAIVGACSAEIDAQLAVFFGSEDLSGPHKARVALRRLTSALDAFGPILRRAPAAEVRAQAKRIFRALGEVRDADVYLADQPEGEARDKLARETAALRDKTRKALRRSRAVAMAPALMRQLGAGALFKSRPRGLAARAEPVGHLARAALDSAWMRAQHHGPDVAALTEEARHDFRKDLKTLRYLAEFFAPLWPGPRWDDFRGALQQLQDDLGLLNDLANARRRGAPADSRREEKALERAAEDWQALAGAPPFWADLPAL